MPNDKTNKYFKKFPLLAKDPNFKLTSNPTWDYNCIAWAVIRQSDWFWPTVSNDGCYWPDSIEAKNKLRNFIELFKQSGYTDISNSAEYEPGYQKVAIYIKNNPKIDFLNQEVTHAARQQITNGLWTSKLGPSDDINHSDPYVLEGEDYGKVGIILKRKFK